MIKTGGEWISSLELEDIISRHEAVGEVAVIGVADEKWGERPVALVVPKADRRDDLDAEDIRAFCNTFAEKGAIPKFGVPDRVVIVDEIAKTSVGKINKKELRKRFGKQG